MSKTIAIEELAGHLDAVLDEVSESRTPYVLTRSSEPKAALVPYDEYLRLHELQESEVLAELDLVLARMSERNDRFSEAEVAADVAAARAEVAR